MFGVLDLCLYSGRFSLADQYKRLKGLIEDRKAVVGVIGLGYVGLPVAVSRRKGFRMRSTPLNVRSLKASDCVLIATDHSLYD